MIALYLIYVARNFSLIDAFFPILQEKPMRAHLVLGGLVYSLCPLYLWLMVRFGEKDTATSDLDIVVFASTHCLMYLYYTLATLGPGDEIIHADNFRYNIKLIQGFCKSLQSIVSTLGGNSI